LKIAVHSDSVLRCAQTGIRNERSVLEAKRKEKKKMKHQFIRFIQNLNAALFVDDEIVPTLLAQLHGHTIVCL